MAQRSLKIGFVIDDSLDKTDGVQQYVLVLGDWLSQRGHEVHYLTSTTERLERSHIHSLSKNMAVRYNGNRLSIPLGASHRKIRRLLETERFDVLHVQMPYSPLLAQRIIMLAAPSVAIISTFHIVPHSAMVTLANRLLARWNGRSLKRLDAVVSVSSAAQDFARQAYGLQTTILPNLIDYRRFATAVPLPRPPGTLRILFLGRLVPRKGCLTLLQAIKQLAETEQRLPAFEVFICGKGPLAQQLQAYVAENRLADMVTFVGYVSEADKPAYLRSADVAVFPSSGGESFGIVLIEAMAAGAAVLAGDNAGYRSVMEPMPELLFKPRDGDDLAQKIYWLLTDDTARRAAADAGHSYARSFDVDQVGNELLKVYRRALLKRRSQEIMKP